MTTLSTEGVGGQLAYRLRLQAGEVKTVWFGVGGSTSGPAQAAAELARSSTTPTLPSGTWCRSREHLNAFSNVSLPSNSLLAQSVAWSKQMLAASEQRVEDLRLREVNAGR